MLDLAPNIRTLTFSLLASLVAAIVLGHIPLAACSSIRVGNRGKIRGEPRARRAPVEPGHHCRTSRLVVLVLVEAGLFARSLSSLRGLDTGFVNGRTVLLANIRPSGTANGMAGVVDLFKELSARSAALHANSVTFSMDTPLGGLSYAKSIDVVSRPPNGGKETVWFNFVGPRFSKPWGSRSRVATFAPKTTHVHPRSL